MKKRTQMILAAFMAVVILCAAPISVSATDVGNEITPYMDNCEAASFSFGVADGTAEFAVSYSARASVFTQAKLTVKIQKQFLLVFWQTVDIGEPDNEWVGYCYDSVGFLSDNFPVTDTGTYRAVFTLEISGSGGTTDVLEETIEYEYS